MRREKPAAVCRKRAIEFGLNAIGISQQQVSAPFGAEAGDISEGETGSRGEVHVSGLRAVHFKGGLKRGRGVIFFDNADQQPWFSTLFGEPITGRIVAAHSGHACQHVVEPCRIERLI